jgi:hypothetical protein
MVYIGIDLHARQFRMSVLDQHNSTIFEQTLPTVNAGGKARWVAAEK